MEQLTAVAEGLLAVETLDNQSVRRDCTTAYDTPEELAAGTAGSNWRSARPAIEQEAAADCREDAQESTGRAREAET